MKSLIFFNLFNDIIIILIIINFNMGNKQNGRAKLVGLDDNNAFADTNQYLQADISTTSKRRMMTDGARSDFTSP